MDGSVPANMAGKCPDDALKYLVVSRLQMLKYYLEQSSPAWQVLPYLVLSPKPLLSNVPSSRQNIQWFQADKGWNATSNSGLSFLVCCGLPGSVTTCVVGNCLVILWKYPAVSPPTPSQTAVSRLSAVLPTNYPSLPPPTNMTVSSCASNLSVIWHAL